MEYLFAYCFSLTSIDLSSFNTSKVQTMRGLFTNCESLESIDVSNFNTSSVISMESMFYDCILLTSLNIENFNTSNIEDMSYMFAFCYSLISINLPQFDTSNAYYMECMFFYCISLISLDLSNFAFIQPDINSMFEGCSSLTSIQFSKDYKSVDNVAFLFKECSSLLEIDLFNFDFGLIDDLRELFYGCYSLTSIELSYIETFSVIYMDNLFYGCNSLKTLDLGTWITSSVKNIQSMFYDCTSLISLDLSNFETSLVLNMKELFYNCIKLTSINLNNFDTSKVTNMELMFYGCISLLSLNLSSFDTSSVISMDSMFFRCIKLTSLNLSNFQTVNVINMASMFYGCTKLEYINIYNFNYDSLYYANNIFYKVSDNLVACMNNKINNSKIISELSALKCFLNDCSYNWEKNKKRIIYNNGTCIDDCKNDKINKYEYEYFCYEECPKGTHPTKDDKYICHENHEKCLKKLPFIFLNNNSCTDNCNSEDFFNGKCELNKFNIENKEIIILNIVNEIENGSMDKLIWKVINDKKDIIIKKNETIFQITSSFNQNYKVYKNLSSIKFGECETILKEKNEISPNVPLIIFKIEQKEKGFLIPLIEYEIFNPNTRKKLNINICKNLNINIYIPISINESILYKYNPNNDYYNDICNITTTEYGTDITLYERKNEYNNNNYSLCLINCKYINFNSLDKMVNCECGIQDGIYFDKTKLFNNVINNKKKINLQIMKCFKLLLSKEGIIRNISNYIIFLIIILHIISGIYFFYKGYIIFCNQIETLLYLRKIIDNESKSKINKNNENYS